MVMSEHDAKDDAQPGPRPRPQAGRRGRGEPAARRADTGDQLATDSYVPSQSSRSAMHSIRTLKKASREIYPGGLVAVVSGVLFVIASWLPFYETHVGTGSSTRSCASLRGTPLYGVCVDRIEGRSRRAADFHWSAWHRFATWIPVLLMCVVILIFVAKALGAQPRKRRLASTALIFVALANAAFFWGLTHMPAGAETRGFGMYMSLVFLVLVDVGALLAFVNVDGIVAARAREREKRITPADPFDKGHYPVGESPRYDTPEPPQPPPPSGYVPPPN